MLGAGNSGTASRNVVGAQNIEVNASAKDTPYTSSSFIKADGIHFLRTADIVAGTNVTTASVSSGRGVQVNVNVPSAITTASLGVQTGHPLQWEFTAPNLADIGTTGGVMPVQDTLEIHQHITGTYDQLEWAAEDFSLPPLRIVPERHLNLDFEGEVGDDYGVGNVLDVIDEDTSLPLIKLNAYTGFPFGPTLNHALRFYRPVTAVMNMELTDFTFKLGISDASNKVIMESGAVTIGAPSGDGLTFGVGGSFNAQYGLFEKDIHALLIGYFSRGAVVGLGRQAYNELGWLFLNTLGTNGVPTGGGQCVAMHGSTRGGEFKNHVTGMPMGSLSQCFWFDDAVKATGDFHTSASVWAVNDGRFDDDVTVGDDLVVTDQITGADLNSTDDLVVGDDATITGDLAVTGASSMTGLRRTVTTKTGDYTATLNDWMMLCDTSINSFTITLPAAATCTGIEYYFQYSNGADTTTIDANGAETFTGPAAYPTFTTAATELPLVATGDWCHIVSTGTEWRIVYGNMSSM